MCIVSTWQLHSFSECKQIDKRGGRGKETGLERRREVGWCMVENGGGAERIDMEPINFFT